MKQIFALCTVMFILWVQSADAQNTDSHEWNDIVYCTLGSKTFITNRKDCQAHENIVMGKVLLYDDMDVLLNKYTRRLSNEFKEVLNGFRADQDGFKRALAAQIKQVSSRVDSVQTDVLYNLNELEQRELDALGVKEIRLEIEALKNELRELRLELALLGVDSDGQ